MKTKLTRGYFGIGIENVKTDKNLGGLWRHAHAFNACFVFAIGTRYKKTPSDTSKTYRHVPFLEYNNTLHFLDTTPKDSIIVGIEIADNARDLVDFVHPERSVYVLGAEDRGLSDELLENCDHLVRIPSQLCLNVATAGAIVMYDRLVKQRRLGV